jgi:hypothetical protein
MNESDLEALLSEKRLSTYYSLFPDDKPRAIQYYQLNTQISESLYPLLSNFEVVLRNSIHNSFNFHYKTDNWYALITYPELADQIRIGKQKILASHNHVTTDKLIAELTLGFWTSLLNKQYAKDFWKPMMHAFPLINNQQKHRDKIAFKLNQIRKFRNRIFHYEPVCNNLSALSTNHSNILEVLHWINADIVSWTQQIDRFDGLYKQVSILRQAV